MRLTTDEVFILEIRHANSYEAAQLRKRLMAEGLHFCSVCKTIKDAEAFPRCDRGRGGRATTCFPCRRKKNRRSGYIPTGLRWRENHARRVHRDPEGVRAERQAGWSEVLGKAQRTPERRGTSSV